MQRDSRHLVQSVIVSLLSLKVLQAAQLEDLLYMYASRPVAGLHASGYLE